MNLRKLALGAAVSAAALFSGVANAGIINWNISGPGTNSVNQTGASTDINYNQPGYGVTRTWTVSGVADDAGNYSFDWNFSGFHSWFQAQASLVTSQGDALLPWSPVSGGFNLGGSYTFSNVAAGQSIGFTIQGYNFDSSALMFGTLSLDQTSNVPEPASLLLAGLGLAGLAAARRKPQ